VLLQLARWAEPAELQDLRRVDGPRAEHYLARRRQLGCRAEHRRVSGPPTVCLQVSRLQVQGDTGPRSVALAACGTWTTCRWTSCESCSRTPACNESGHISSGEKSRSGKMTTSSSDRASVLRLAAAAAQPEQVREAC
jgi:hypothetical protein